MGLLFLFRKVFLFLFFSYYIYPKVNRNERDFTERFSKNKNISELILPYDSDDESNIELDSEDSYVP